MDCSEVRGGRHVEDRRVRRHHLDDFAFCDDIGLPPDGPSSGIINIPLPAPTLTAFFGGNAKGNIQYDMSVTIDATDAAAGGGFLEFAMANVSDPLMPPHNRRHSKHHVQRDPRAGHGGTGVSGDGWLECGDTACPPTDWRIR